MAYGTDEGFTAWLTASGHELPEGAPSPAVLRLRGSRYIDATYGDRFLGEPTGGLAQARSWPRTGVPGIGNDEVPSRVEEAAYEAAFQEATTPGSLSASGSFAARVVRERVEGAVDISYSDGSGDLAKDLAILFTAIDGLLAPFLRKEVTGIAIWSIG